MTILLSYQFLKYLGTIQDVTYFFIYANHAFYSVGTTNKMATKCLSVILGVNPLVCYNRSRFTGSELKCGRTLASTSPKLGQDAWQWVWVNWCHKEGDHIAHLYHVLQCIGNYPTWAQCGLGGLLGGWCLSSEIWCLLASSVIKQYIFVPPCGTK